MCTGRKTHTHAGTQKSYLTLSDVQIADGSHFLHQERSWWCCHESGYQLGQGQAAESPEDEEQGKRWKAQRQILSVRRLAQTQWRNMSVCLLLSNVACSSKLLPEATPHALRNISRRLDIKTRQTLCAGRLKILNLNVWINDRSCDEELTRSALSGKEELSNTSSPDRFRYEGMTRMHVSAGDNGCKYTVMASINHI